MPRFYRGMSARYGGVPWQQPQQDNTGPLIAAVLQLGPLADEKQSATALQALIQALPNAPSTAVGDAGDQLNKIKPALADFAGKSANRAGQSRTGVLLSTLLNNNGGGGNNNNALVIALLAGNGGL